MSKAVVSRRDLIAGAMTSVAAGLVLMAKPDFVFAGQSSDEELVPFQNEPRSKPNSLDWESLTEWLTPDDQVFSVQHYGIPDFDAAKFDLEITGLVERPRKFTLDELKGLARAEQPMTLECSGNGSSAGFMNAVYNSRWIGTPLAPFSRSAA